MVIFTYNDYLDCTTNYKIKKIIETKNKIIKNEKVYKKEKIKKEKIKNEKIKNKKIKEKTKEEEKEIENKIEIKINKIIEKLINEKEEIINLINDYFKIEEKTISKTNLENIFKIENIESKIYKIKNQEIFFFIKLQKNYNYNMPFIILNECIEFMNNFKKENLNSKKPPIIIPIVIYIGKEKINIKKNAKIKYTSFEENKINLSYNLINLSESKNIDLIKNKSQISKIILFKSEISKETKQKLLKTIKNRTNKIDIYLELEELEKIILTKGLDKNQ